MIGIEENESEKREKEVILSEEIIREVEGEGNSWRNLKREWKSKEVVGWKWIIKGWIWEIEKRVGKIIVEKRLENKKMRRIGIVIGNEKINEKIEDRKGWGKRLK